MEIPGNTEVSKTFLSWKSLISDILGFQAGDGDHSCSNSLNQLRKCALCKRKYTGMM
jgi:hypothetical protein